MRAARLSSSRLKKDFKVGCNSLVITSELGSQEGDDKSRQHHKSMVSTGEFREEEENKEDTSSFSSDGGE
jgi:hypothetical protein